MYNPEGKSPEEVAADLIRDNIAKFEGPIEDSLYEVQVAFYDRSSKKGKTVEEVSDQSLLHSAEEVVQKIHEDLKAGGSEATILLGDLVGNWQQVNPNGIEMSDKEVEHFAGLFTLPVLTIEVPDDLDGLNLYPAEVRSVQMVPGEPDINLDVKFAIQGDKSLQTLNKPTNVDGDVIGISLPVPGQKDSILVYLSSKQARTL